MQIICSNSNKCNNNNSNKITENQNTNNGNKFAIATERSNKQQTTIQNTYGS